MEKITFKVFEVIEYVVEIDPEKINCDYKLKICKQYGLPPTLENAMRVETGLTIGRREYLRRTSIEKRTFKQGEPPMQITINENT